MCYLINKYRAKNSPGEYQRILQEAGENLFHNESKALTSKKERVYKNKSHTLPSKIGVFQNSNEKCCTIGTSKRHLRSGVSLTHFILATQWRT